METFSRSSFSPSAFVGKLWQLSLVEAKVVSRYILSKRFWPCVYGRMTGFRIREFTHQGSARLHMLESTTPSWHDTYIECRQCKVLLWFRFRWGTWLRRRSGLPKCHQHNYFTGTRNLRLAMWPEEIFPILAQSLLGCSKRLSSESICKNLGYVKIGAT